MKTCFGKEAKFQDSSICPNYNQFLFERQNIQLCTEVESCYFIGVTKLEPTPGHFTPTYTSETNLVSAVCMHSNDECTHISVAP